MTEPRGPTDAEPAARASDERAARDGRAPLTRRAMLAGAAGAAAGLVLGDAGAAIGAAHAQASAPVTPVIPADPSTVPGSPSEALGARSPFVRPALAPTGVTTGSTFTPLQDLSGTITPADLHFQRHHNGIALIDPSRYELLVHGLVERPLAFTLDALRRYPAVTRIHFVECSGNGRAAYRAPKREMTPQVVDGLTSNSEWTGVPLSTLLREVGAVSDAKWILAEGGDASRLSRSVPMEKAMDDAIIAYAQNGEPLRAANGYPVRLLLPGFEGNMNIKWLRRLKLTARPTMTRDETSKYTDPLSGDMARQFSFVMDAKSIITAPAYPSRLTAPGWWPVTGIAWSGRGRITRVDVSVDGGRRWVQAELEGAALPQAHTRFRLMWRWDGRPTTLLSRAVDETGYTQPTLAEFRRVRGAGTDYHFNYIRGWDVESDGRVYFAVES